MYEHQQIQQSQNLKPSSQRRTAPANQTRVSHPASIIQHARISPKSLTSAGVLQLQCTIGNRAVGRLFSEIKNPSKVQQAPIQRQEIPEEEPLQGMFESKPEKETCSLCMQRQEIPEEEESLQGKMIGTIQRQEIPEEEEPLQGKMIQSIQRQEIPEEEEPLQGKMVETVQRQEISEKEEPLQTKRENNTGMPDNLKAGMESLSELDMSDVKVHYNSSKPAKVGALAYTQGTDIHVAPGQEKHLPHEAWHVVQQKKGRVRPTMQLKGVSINDDDVLEKEAEVMGEKAKQGGNKKHVIVSPNDIHAAFRTGICQCYYEKSYNTGIWVQSDDTTVAVKKGYPNHDLYAKVGKVAEANTKLKAVNSGIELIEKAEEKNFRGKGKKRIKTKLRKVEAKNKQNNTEGDDMLLWADCGKSNSVIVGSEDRQAIYNKPGEAVTRAPGSPTEMKIDIIKKWLENAKINASKKKESKIEKVINEAKDLEKELADILKAYTNASNNSIKDMYIALYFEKLDQIAEKYWSYYNTLPKKERGKVDKTLKINLYAKPDVGQGYTISSGGPSAGEDTWNFHWGGVIMTSDDSNDTVVLENYAVGDPTVQNKDWTFDIYGTKKKGQSFHERHLGTRQHGTTPTTMTIEKQ